MSRIEKLIQEICPDGVEFVTLEDVARTVSGLTGKTKADFSDGNARFVTYKNAFSNLAVDDVATDFVKVEDGERQNSLRLGDVVITGSSENVDEVGMSSVVVREPMEPLYLNSFCFALRFDHPTLLPEFSKYLFRGEAIRNQIRKSASGVTRINVSKPRFMKVRIPVPPLEVQREIVRVLDKFTQLEAELEAELEARRAQLGHYLLDLTNPFADDGSVKQGWNRARVGEVAEVSKGKSPIQKSKPGAYPLITTGEERRSSHSFDFDGDAVCVPLVSSKGHGVASLSRLYFQSGKFALGSILAAIIPDDRECLSAEFLYYYLSARKESLLVRLMRGGANVTLTIDSLKAVRIYFPNCTEQEMIVNALRRIGSLTDGGEASLQAELAARRKQYAHYRDRLLTFKELTA